MSNIKEWEELGSEVAFSKYSRKLMSVDFRLPNGTVADFIIIQPKPAVCTLGITEDDKVILARQYRPGPRKILDELPGGYIESGKDALEEAKREFREETGYIGDFELAGECLDDAYSTMSRKCFVAKNCKKVGEPQNDDIEQTEVILLSIEDFRKHLRQGQMTDVEVGYIGLDYLGLL